MKINVLDAGFIESIDYLGDDLTVVNSARVSFGKRKTIYEEGDRKLVTFLAKNKHYSPARSTDRPVILAMSTLRLTRLTTAVSQPILLGSSV